MSKISEIDIGSALLSTFILIGFIATAFVLVKFTIMGINYININFSKKDPKEIEIESERKGF